MKQKRLESILSVAPHVPDVFVRRVGGRGRSREDRAGETEAGIPTDKDRGGQGHKYGKGYTVTGCEVINGADVDNWNSSYCARVQIGLVADSGYEFRKKGSSYFDLKGSDVYRFVSREYEGNEEVWLYVDMIPMNKKIGVPLDPDWSGTGTAKWSQAYTAVSYHVTLYENGKKRTSETVKRGNTIDFSGQMKEGKLYTFFVTAENSDGKKSKAGCRTRDRLYRNQIHITRWRYSGKIRHFQVRGSRKTKPESGVM